MFYPKNTTDKLEKTLFESPTSEYRGTPFWAWNCKLDADELCRQIDVLKAMGMGGFHMHSRSGMATDYLSDDFMSLVKTCLNKAKQNEMRCYLYDEDRWPSGAAGGLVTRDHKYRAQFLLLTPTPYGGFKGGESIDGDAVAARTEDGELLARFNVELENGYLKSYRRLAADESGENIWYAYLEKMAESPWYNNQAYLNTLDKAAVQKFIEVTHERYYECVGADFGGTIPTIFTDEPQFTRKGTLSFADAREDVTLPFTADFPDTFRTAYGEEILDRLPELLWDLPEGNVSLIRYHYHDHIAERFASAFADTIGDWCKAHGIMLTGHMMEEPTLKSQTAALGDCMRSYRSFQYPGIDMLCDRREFTTAKQAQSACHQFGNPGVMSELYGVTTWNFDFRGHKLQGDWQAALGVTLRVPHLSWVSMGGEAKRDYPASINYQSPWYQQYNYIEDYFSRINTALTRGKADIKVGVVHPVESYWLHWGPNEQSAGARDELDSHFEQLCRWLLLGTLDFDYISESLLPIQCAHAGAPLKVGQMEYEVVLVPDCETLRASTVERLEAFAAAGGKLIFAGRVPCLVDAMPSARVQRLAETAQVIPFSRTAVLDALDGQRQLEIRLENGKLSDHIVTQLRTDGADKWLFIANAFNPNNPDVTRVDDLTIRMSGEWNAEQYDALDGRVKPLDYNIENGQTVIKYTFHAHDSLLAHLTTGEIMADGEQSNISTEKRPVRVVTSSQASHMPQLINGNEGAHISGLASVKLSEPNVLMLDMAEYALDGEPYSPREEMLRIDAITREKLDWPARGKNYAQPWVDADKPDIDGKHELKLRFTFTSDIAVRGAMLAIEEVERAQIELDGVAVDNAQCGWWVDKAINTVRLPGFAAGAHQLVVTIDLKRKGNLEWCYLLGEFGVKLLGDGAKLIAPVTELAYGDWTSQGLPFYAGNVTYEFDVEAGKNGILLEIPQYRGAVAEVFLDGARIGLSAFAPYRTKLNAAPGKHSIGITVYGNRANAFGPVHNCDTAWPYHGPQTWHSRGKQWSYTYRLNQMGLLVEPTIHL